MKIPKGIIILWSGAIVDIPAGWHLCDGTAGTPELRDRFVIAAGDTYNPGDRAGSAAHVHTFTTNGHFHTLTGGPEIGGGTELENFTSTDVDTGTTDPGSTNPLYYSLAFIMKL